MAGTDEVVERRFESAGLRMQPAAAMLLLPAAVAVFWQTVEAVWIHLHPCLFPLSSFSPSSIEEKKTIHFPSTCKRTIYTQMQSKKN